MKWSKNPRIIKHEREQKRTKRNEYGHNTMHTYTYVQYVEYYYSEIYIQTSCSVVVTRGPPGFASLACGLNHIVRQYPRARPRFRTTAERFYCYVVINSFGSYFIHVVITYSVRSGEVFFMRLYDRPTTLLSR